MFARLKKSFSIWLGECASGIQLARSAWIMSHIKAPIVTIFGGSRVQEDNDYLKYAYNLGQQLVEADFAVLTGGGPGIMYAVNCGANHAASKKNKKTLWSIGIGVRGVDDDFDNQCVSHFVAMNSFASRKYLLMNYSIGFIVFPGGIGTLNEVFELCNALKHNYMSKQSIVFIGKNFWQPFLDWIKQHILEQGYAVAETKDFFVATDSLDEAINIMQKQSNKNYKKNS